MSSKLRRLALRLSSARAQDDLAKRDEMVSTFAHEQQKQFDANHPQPAFELRPTPTVQEAVDQATYAGRPSEEEAP